MTIISLTTDFGIEDEYAGVMKGVILSINPDVTIVDITHHIHPHDLIQTAYTIDASYEYFPVGTVHLVVVDPGVGSERPLLALEKKGHFFLAPDNGVLTLLLDGNGIDSIVHVNNTRYYLHSISQTFHGRDIFAPVGAHLSLGVKIEELGDKVKESDVVRLDIKKSECLKDTEIIGYIVSIDRFGNLISNIDLEVLEPAQRNNLENNIQICIGEKRINGLSSSYENNGSQEPIAIIGSRGTIEIAVNQGSAEKYFKAEKGDMIRVLI